jgi:hypothetical protein
MCILGVAASVLALQQCWHADQWLLAGCVLVQTAK